MPYIHAQRFASMAILNFMRLTIEINYHSGFRGQAPARCLFVVLIRDFNFFDLWQNHETGSRQFWPLLLPLGVKKYDLLCKIGSGQWDWGRDKCFSQCSVCRDPCQMLPQATIHSCSNLKPQTFKNTFWQTLDQNSGRGTPMTVALIPSVLKGPKWVLFFVRIGDR